MYGVLGVLSTKGQITLLFPTLVKLVHEECIGIASFMLGVTKYDDPKGYVKWRNSLLIELTSKMDKLLTGKEFKEKFAEASLDIQMGVILTRYIKAKYLKSVTENLIKILPPRVQLVAMS